jgi:hypothetical protein
VKKVDLFKRDLETIEKELQTLSTFRKTPQLEKFVRQLHGERSFIKRQIDQASGIVHRRGATPEQLARAQHNRSEKNKRNWRYAKAISDTYGIPVRKVRSELKRRKEGLESEIKDVQWRNPSP